MLFRLISLLFLVLSSVVAKELSHSQLVKLAADNHGVINLDEHTYDSLTAPKRNWTAIVHFTALDKRRRCAPCREFDPSFKAVAKAWSTVPQPDRDGYLFATVDFDNAVKVFQKLSLQSAPVVYVFPATEGPYRPANGKTNPFKYDFGSGFEAEPLAAELSRHTPIPIPYKAPIDWAFWGSAGIILLSLLLTIKFIAPVLQNKWTWAVITVLTSTVMTSGFMFVRIRGMPTVAPNGQWIAPGYQNQYGQETQVISIIYGLLALSFLMLTAIVPYQKSPSRQRAQIYIWTAVTLIIYSVLISLFKMKNRGYPFKLFL